MANSRLVSGLQIQGVDENKTYVIDFQYYVDQLGAISSVNNCTLYDFDLDQYVNEKLSGAMESSGALVKSKLVSGLVANHFYQLNVIVNFPPIAGQTQVRSAYVRIKGEL